VAAQIEVDDDVFQALQQHATPFVDTPNSVLRRLVGLDANGHRESGDRTRPAAIAAPSKAASHPSSKLASSATTSAKIGRRRAKRGTLLPEQEYELPILRYLDAHGGRAPSKEVVEGIAEELSERLTAEDRKALSSGETRWKSRAAFARLRLVEREELDGHAPRGTWQITDKGRQHVEAER
jgi:hypothetical protein